MDILVPILYIPNIESQNCWLNSLVNLLKNLSKNSILLVSKLLNSLYECYLKIFVAREDSHGDYFHQIIADTYIIRMIISLILSENINMLDQIIIFLGELSSGNNTDWIIQIVKSDILSYSKSILYQSLCNIII